MPEYEVGVGTHQSRSSSHVCRSGAGCDCRKSLGPLICELLEKNERLRRELQNANRLLSDVGPSFPPPGKPAERSWLIPDALRTVLFVFRQAE